jgi:hypothetical protein
MASIRLYGSRTTQSKIPDLTSGLALQCSRFHKHVALKVLRSECYGGKHDIFEVSMLEKISKISSIPDIQVNITFRS